MTETETITKANTIHGYTESKWGTARFDLQFWDPAGLAAEFVKPVHTNLDWPQAWKVLARDYGLRGDEIETLLRSCADRHRTVPTRLV